MPPSPRGPTVSEDPRTGRLIDNFVGLVLAFCVLTMLVLFIWGFVMDQLVASTIAGVGIVVVIFVGAGASGAPDSLRSQATERTLRTASSTLESMGAGLTQDGCRSVCSLLLPETRAIAVAMTDRERVLAFVGEGEEGFPPGVAIRTRATREVIESGRLQTFASITSRDEGDMDWLDAPQRLKLMNTVPAGIVVPLVVRGTTVGTIKFYYRSYHEIDHTQLAVSRGFGELLSTQLSSYELEKQAQLTAQAEVKALQAQINPHFLFNTINTIAALTRTDPLRARSLLREFAVFYRQTLENSESLITLERELEQTHRYLTFEHARFGDDRIAVLEHVEAGCEQVLVPAFVIQPVVENAVRHAMREQGTLHIDIHVTREDNDVLIAVADDGMGMDEETAQALIAPRKSMSKDEKGTGIALRNVTERLERFYGPGSGIDVMSRPDEGTVVTLHLVDAATKGPQGAAVEEPVSVEAILDEEPREA